MDLGLNGKTAIVCGSSQGLGFACAMALAEEGVNVVVNGRYETTLHDAADRIRERTGRPVTAVAADITTPAGRAALIAAAPESDILITNCAGAGRGDFREWREAEWNAALLSNMVAPILMIQGVIDGMAARGFGRIVNITSRAVRTPLPGFGLSNGARTGLTGFVAGLAREVASQGVAINNLLPGPFLTTRTLASVAAEAERTGAAPDDILKKRAAAVPVGRLGSAEEFGHACAFLCSTRSGYIVGQNLLLDGGGFVSTF